MLLITLLQETLFKKRFESYKRRNKENRASSTNPAVAFLLGQVALWYVQLMNAGGGRIKLQRWLMLLWSLLVTTEGSLGIGIKDGGDRDRGLQRAGGKDHKSARMIFRRNGGVEIVAQGYNL